MRDSDFKALKHCCDDFVLYSNGSAINKNYSPDCVLKRHDEYVIIEHETEPNRKTVVADIFKAAYFLQGKKEGVLVIVMTPKGTSSFESYPKHSLPYFEWLSERTNLRDVYFIQESLYFKEENVLTVRSDVFNQISTSLYNMLHR